MDRVEAAQIAPVMRAGFIQRRMQIIAQRRSQRGFVTGLYRDGIDQGREQAFAFWMKKIAQAPSLRRTGDELRARLFPAARAPRLRRLRLRLRWLRACGGHATGALRRRARRLGVAVGGSDIGRGMGIFHGAVETRPRIVKLGGAGFGQARRQVAAAAMAGLVGVPVGQIPRSAFPAAVRLRSTARSAPPDCFGGFGDDRLAALALAMFQRLALAGEVPKAP